METIASVSLISPAAVTCRFRAPKFAAKGFKRSNSKLMLQCEPQRAAAIGSRADVTGCASQWGVRSDDERGANFLQEK